MKILCISDNEINELYQGWTDEKAEKLSDVGLILSAGDLNPRYLEFLVTMLNVPLLYVRGNHDTRYDEEPPEGCLGVDDKTAEIIIREDGTGDICENVFQSIQGVKAGMAEKAALREKSRLIRVAGLGGSIRFDFGPGEAYPPEDEFTEEEMRARAGKLRWMLKSYAMADRMLCRDAEDGPLDILLTHSPAFGHGDIQNDPMHTGFRCFNDLMTEVRPKYHIYGHVHPEYGRIERGSTHPSGTEELNVCGMYMLEI